MSEDAQKEEEAPFICGVILKLRRDGNGVEVGPLEGKEFLRQGTISDLQSIHGIWGYHLESITLAGQIMEVLSNLGIIKLRGKGGIIH